MRSERGVVDVGGIVSTSSFCAGVKPLVFPLPLSVQSCPSVCPLDEVGIRLEDQFRPRLAVITRLNDTWEVARPAAAGRGWRTAAERVGADWKEFGENKGEKTQLDRRAGGQRWRGVRLKLRPMENRVCWKSCCDDDDVVTNTMFTRFSGDKPTRIPQYVHNIAEEIDLDP